MEHLSHFRSPPSLHSLETQNFRLLFIHQNRNAKGVIYWTVSVPIYCTRLSYTSGVCSRFGLRTSRSGCKEHLGGEGPYHEYRRLQFQSRTLQATVLIKIILVSRLSHYSYINQERFLKTCRIYPNHFMLASQRMNILQTV